MRNRIVATVDEHTPDVCLVWDRIEFEDGDNCSGRELPHWDECRCVVIKVYPEHDKIKALNGANDRVGEFLEWLDSKHWIICEVDDFGRFYPIGKGIQGLLAEHFEINLQTLDDEKRAMLDELRRRNES